MNYRTDCTHFTGAKPCGLSKSDCPSICSSYKKRGAQILLIHLGALGAVVRSTGLIPLIKQKFPDSEITWVTDKPAHFLLNNHPDLKRVFTSDFQDLLKLSNFHFDHAFVVDKDLKASGILKMCLVKNVYGFLSDESGVIRPLNSGADKLWELGLNDEKKFFINQQTELELLAESFELKGQLKGYHLPLNKSEIDEAQSRHQMWSQNQKVVVGINTGCAAVLPAKKLSVQNHRDLIKKLLRSEQNYQIVLLGGPEDTQRNSEIAENLDVIQSPTEKGLRDGLISVAACDVVFTGDSLGMHMAISQNKRVVAWFGPSCHQEIDLFGRGEKILTQASCSPCWKRSCQQPVMCYDLVDLQQVVEAIHRQTRSDQLHNSNSFFGRSTSFHTSVSLD